MSEHARTIRKICMVSSAVFSAASVVYNWTAVIGAGLGLVVNLTEDSYVQIEDFDKAVKDALEKTKQNMTSETSKKIIEELSTKEVEPDNLSDIIKKLRHIRLGIARS